MRLRTLNMTLYGILVGGLVFFAAVSLVARRHMPVIYETSVLPATWDGQFGIEYRYVVNGEESAVFLIGRDELERYRDYLRQYGRIYGEDR